MFDFNGEKVKLKKLRAKINTEDLPQSSENLFGEPQHDDSLESAEYLPKIIIQSDYELVEVVEGENIEDISKNIRSDINHKRSREELLQKIRGKWEKREAKRPKHESTSRAGFASDTSIESAPEIESRSEPSVHSSVEYNDQEAPENEEREESEDIGTENEEEDTFDFDYDFDDENFDEDSSDEYEEEQSDTDRETFAQLFRKLIYSNPKYYLGIDDKKIFLIQLMQKHSNLSERDILLTLHKICLNESFEGIADKFAVSRNHAARIFKNAVPKLAALIGSFVYWPSSEDIKRRLPLKFKAKFSKVVSIIDCFEIYTGIIVLNICLLKINFRNSYFQISLRMHWNNSFHLARIKEEIHRSSLSVAPQMVW